ncbi:AAA family ATPase [Nocardioides conyzicola]|uniref:LuxR family transcriptional regulator n=1 Tax=Nocardioides conyzicola TaxID=1651781 RepID=A0ABP8X3X0_9ACTN
MSGSAGSGLWAGELDGLVGRDDLLARLRDLLGEGGRCAALVGIPGAGKSAVLGCTARAAAAEGWTVLTVTGHAADQGLPFAALVDLLAGAGATDALEQVFAGDPLRLRLDVAGRLEQRAGSGRLLVVLDDVQWFDESSLAVLGFVANRLAGTQVSVVAAARGEQPPDAFLGHPTVEVPALSESQAGLVLRRAGLDLDALAFAAVIDRSAGNPLALLELGRAASSGVDELGLSTVEAAFAAELVDLPAPTRRVLLLAAAGGGDLGVLGRVGRPGQMVAALAVAETTGLVRVVERQVQFRHPLARAAAYSVATTEERLSAHDDLATAYDDDPDRRAWHRAEATVVADEDVAVQLVAAAERAKRRGAGFEATRMMMRAAELSPLRADHDERMLAALAMGFPVGHFEWLAQAAARLREESDDPATRARASHFVAYALAQTMRQTDARLALVDALDQLVHVDQGFGWASLTTLATLTYATGGDTRLVADWLERYDREATPSEGPALVMERAARAWVRALIDPLARPADVLALVRDAPPFDASYPPELVASQEMLLGAAAWILDEPTVARTRQRRAVELMQRAEGSGQLSQTLACLALLHFDVGLYDEVEQAARMLSDVAEVEQLSYAAGNARELRARVAGVRGDVALARRLCAEVLLDIEIGECLALEMSVRVAMSYVHFDEHDPVGVHEQLRGLFRPDGEPVHQYLGYRHLADYVAAAVRAGAADEVGPVMEVAALRMTNPGPRHRLQLARARALIADDPEPFHLEATADPEAAQWPFELANAQLEYGVWLRRQHRPTAARTQLRAAYEVFGRLGARAWADLARTELRAAGVATAQSSSSAWGDLTAQERQVVRLAASGLTNREIGASLYLSPRTVSAHLYNAFPKLGVTARSQLRDIVEAREGS